MDQITYARAVLKEKYQYIRERNPYFSFRAYSRKLEIAVSTFSNFVSQKADIGPELLDKIMLKVLNEEEYTSFKALIYKEATVLQIGSVAELGRLDESVRFKGLYKKAPQDHYYVFAGDRAQQVISKKINCLVIEISDLLAKQDFTEEKKLYRVSLSGAVEVLDEVSPKNSQKQREPYSERDQRLCRNL